MTPLSSIVALLQTVLILITAVHNTPQAPQAMRDTASAIVQSALTLARSQLSGPYVSSMPTVSSTAASGTGVIASSTSSNTNSSTLDPSPRNVPQSATSGAAGIVMGIFKVHPVNEDFSLNEITLKLTSGTASDLARVYVYRGATLLGTVPLQNGSPATAPLTPSTFPRDTDTDLVVRADIAPIGTNQPAVAGDIVKIEVQQLKGTGAVSGTTITSSGITNASGVMIQKSVPIVALVQNQSIGAGDGSLIKFSVTADRSGPVTFASAMFNSVITGATVSNVALYGYTDSIFSTPVPGFSNGVLSSNSSTINSGTPFTLSATAGGGQGVTIPAGSTYYFAAKGTVAPTASNYSVSTTLLGDAATTALTSQGSVSGNFVWSPNSNTSSPSFSSADWTNGYGLSGLPSVGLTQTRSQ